MVRCSIFHDKRSKSRAADTNPSIGSYMTIRLLFLNTRDQCGADVAVHLMLMANFASDDVEVFVISNSEAADAEDMRGSPCRNASCD